MAHMYINYRIMDGKNFLFFELYDKNNVIISTSKNFQKIGDLLSDKGLVDKHILLSTYSNSDKSYKLTNEELMAVQFEINKRIPNLEIIVANDGEKTEFSNN